MNIFIIIAILIANIIAVVLTYHFLKTLDRKENIMFIAIAIAINYIVVSIIYWLSSIGIEQVVTQTAKSFVTYMFVPVNMIVLMPIIANTYCKAKLKQLNYNQLKKRLIIVAVVGIILFIFEFFYFKSIQVNIANYNFIK